MELPASNYTLTEAIPLEPDRGAAERPDDADSSLGDIDYVSQRTQSVTGSVYNYRYEGGRRYHAYHANLYLLPNDESEQDRLDLQHHLFRITLDGPLYIAPIPKDIHNVFDVGCGTGIWAIEFAEEHPSAAVLGVDISPIQPAFVPVNCRFRVDNIESDWIPEENFDFIHCRAMVAGIKNWSRFFEQAFEHLNPGGYIEVQDICFPIRCQSPADSTNSKLIYYNELFLEIGKRLGWDLEAPMTWRDKLQAAGFIDIHMQWFNWPVGPWAKHRKNKVMGQITFLDFYDGLSSVETVFTRVLGWTPEATQVLIAEMRKEMKEQRLHFYQPVCFCYAKTPGRLSRELDPTIRPTATISTAIPTTVRAKDSPDSTNADSTVPATAPTTTELARPTA